MDVSGALSELVAGYAKLPLFQKIAFPLIIVASVVGIVYVSKWANKPGYAVLFSDLEPADSAMVVERLKEQKTAYELRDGGRVVAISPPEMVHELRISLAADGVPKGGTIGLEIFDEVPLGTTTRQEMIRFLRARQGELERTISAMDAVQSARVAITQPEKTVFAKDSAQATASVLLLLRPGGELDKRQVKGIANLVAGSVESLKPENVNILDVYGNLLHPTEEEEEGLLGEATRLQFRKDIEKSYVQRIEQMLTKIVGPDKVVARVTADMDFSQLEREEEIYDPGGQVMRSERSIEEGAGSSQRGGVPGVVSNLGDDPSLLTPPGGDESNSSRKELVRNFEVSRAVSKVSAPRGKLERLSVAVLVDGNYVLPEGASKNAPKEFVPLDPEVLSQIESVVRSAVGFDALRGDTLTVENLPFFTPENKFGEALEAQAFKQEIFDWMRGVFPFIFLLLFFMMLVKPLVRFLITPTEAEVDLARLLPTGLAELEDELEQERSKAKVPEYEPEVDLDQLNELIAENSRTVKGNPEQAALLIRYWLNDGRM